MNEIKILIQLTHPAAVAALLDAAENTPEELENAAGELAALYAWEPLTVAAGSFVCEIPRALVFTYLWKFEQLDKVPQKEKTRYTREKEGGAAFFVTIPKEAAQLAKFAGVDECRPAVMQIYLDVERAALVATDTHILAEYPAEVEGAEVLDETAPAIFVNPKHIKNLIGRCRVQLVEETDEAETSRDGAPKHFTAVFTNEAGDVYKNELTGLRFPDYRRPVTSNLPRAPLRSSQNLQKQLTSNPAMLLCSSRPRRAKFPRAWFLLMIGNASAKLFYLLRIRLRCRSVSVSARPRVSTLLEPGTVAPGSLIRAGR